MKFTIEQIAISPVDPDAAIKLLSEMGAPEWVLDSVFAEGEVWETSGQNVADLSFNYQMDRNVTDDNRVEPRVAKPLEFEVLHYIDGPNWLHPHRTSAQPSIASHIGMHCSEAELEEWKDFFEERDIGIAQEVNTTRHTNAAIAGKRRYHYCIFNTRHILGVDVKFIVRHEVDRID